MMNKFIVDREFLEAIASLEDPSPIITAILAVMCDGDTDAPVGLPASDYVICTLLLGHIERIPDER